MGRAPDGLLAAHFGPRLAGGPLGPFEGAGGLSGLTFSPHTCKTMRPRPRMGQQANGHQQVRRILAQGGPLGSTGRNLGVGRRPKGACGLQTVSDQYSDN